MSNKHGDFIWYELMTDDAAAASRFYGDIFGWQSMDSGQSDKDYRIQLAKDPDTGETNAVGAFLQLDKDMQAGGARPAWVGYIGVEDVDAAVRSVVKAGGSILMPAWDVPDVGRMAMLMDPEGAPFYMMRGASDEKSMAFADDRPRLGHCAWNELSANDPAKAMSFYCGQFGWQKDGEMDMGPIGNYEFLRHGGMMGAIMKKPDEAPMPMWNFYFRVADIDAAVKKITSGGGQIIQGPQDIPGGEFTVNALDPQGAPFSVIGVSHTR